MYSHEPEGYRCPYCEFLAGGEHTWTRDADVVHRGERVTAFVSPEQWPRNPGHCLVIPNDHYENLYVLPLPVAALVHEVSRALALAMKRAFACAGTSTRQHNEPAGYQEVWLYHNHVFPRHVGDQLYGSRKARVEESVRAEQARALREALQQLAEEGVLGAWEASR